MKLKHFYAIALFALFFTACTKDEPHTVEEEEVPFTDASTDEIKTITHEGQIFEVRSLDQYNEHLQSTGRDPVFLDEKGTIWSSEAAYQKSKTQRDGYHAFRVDPADNNASLLLYAQDGGVMYQLTSCDGCTATIGLPWGGDHCSILTDYQIFLIDASESVYNSPLTWCTNISLQYLKNYSTLIDEDVLDQRTNWNEPNKTTMLAVKDGMQNSPSESAIKIGYCGTSEWTDLCSDY